MKIKELNIDVFGGVKNKKILLSDGLNLLCGENESGKSTILLFIKFMMYGMPRKGHEERDRSISRSEHCARGSMTLSFEGEEYRIERSFVENGRGGTDRHSLYRLSDGAEVFGDREPWEIFLKVPREVFESSAFVGQMHCEPNGGKKTTDAIRNLLSSADENTDISKIVDKLERIRVTYRHKTGKAGRLHELSGAIHQERQAWEKALSDRERIAQLEENSQKLGADYEKAEAGLQHATEVMQRLGKIDVLRRFDTLGEKRKSLARLNHEINELKEAYLLTDRMPTEADAERLRALADRLEEAEEARRAAEDALDALSENEEYDEEYAEVGRTLETEGGAEGIPWQAERLRGKKKALHGIGMVLLLLAIAGGGIGIVLLSDWIPLAIALSAAVLGVFLFWRGSTASRRLKELAGEYGVRPSELARYLIACEDAYRESLRARGVRTEKEADLRSAQTTILRVRERMEAELVKTLPAEDVVLGVEEAREEADRLLEFLEAYGGLNTKSHVLAERIEEETRSLSAYDEEGLRRELSALGEKFSTVDPLRAEQELRFYKTQRDLLKQKKDRAEVERISLRATAVDPMPLYDRLIGLEAEYARAEEYADAVELAITALREASDTMSGTVTPILGKRAGEMMEFLSNGRYSRLFAGNDLIPALEGEEGLRVPTELLSGGTRDAAYLSLRLALMMQIYEGEIPPLLMDESLCQLDQTRMGRALTLLGRLCEGPMQALLFTCHERETEYCREKGISFREITL